MSNSIYTTMMSAPIGAGGPSYTTGAGTATYTITGGGGTGAVGASLMSNGTSANWGTVITANPNLQGKTLHVEGSANITGELTVQGVSLSERLDKIEEKLAILRPNEELEEKWDQLKGLRKAYMELEAEIIEKQKVWEILKK